MILNRRRRNTILSAPRMGAHSKDLGNASITSVITAVKIWIVFLMTGESPFLIIFIVNYLIIFNGVL